MAGCRERAALEEGLSKGPRQDWAGFVQGTVRRLSAQPPLLCSTSSLGRRGETQPPGGAPSRGRETDGVASQAVWGKAPFRGDDESGCWSLYPGFQDPGWPHPWRWILGCVSTGKHSVPFTASAALTKLESQLGLDGGWHVCPTRRPKGLLPPGALSWWSHSHQEPSWTVWYFPQRGLVQPALLKIRKLGPRRGRASLTVVVCKDSGSRLRSRFCPLGHLPATAAFQVLRTPLGKTLS